MRALAPLLVATLALGGCSLVSDDPAPAVTTTVTADPSGPTPEPQPTVTVTAQPDPAEPDRDYARPLWLGQVPLEVQEDNLGERGPTPPELRDRQLAPRPWLPDPATDEWFATIEPVPADVAARSSWEPDCPAPMSDLAYVTMPYWGFDELVHTGEMIVAAEHAEDVVGVFEKIYAAGFPIEEMRVISRADVEAPPTGDQNVTSAFTCRKIVGAVDAWSQHAYGLAIDINPFHNPFYRGEELFPELSEAYLDRDNDRRGMIHDPSVVYDAFEEIGWEWGGHWEGREDWMHFSAEGG